MTVGGQTEEKISTYLPSASPLSIRKRITNKPSIQLDVLSADRLMPAKKVRKNIFHCRHSPQFIWLIIISFQKGSSGREGSIPDRKPCLKVSLSLPVINSSNAQEFFAFRLSAQGPVLKNSDPASSAQLKKVV